MSASLKGKSLTKELDFSAAQFHYLLNLAAELKAATKAGA